MYNTAPVMHIIQKGDSLYQLAKYYQTTIPEIMSLNPNINPQNLIVGNRLFIPAGSHPQPEKPNKPSPEAKTEVMNALRLAWEQQIYWTRMALLSIVGGLEGQQATINRLLENPQDMAVIFSKYYPTDIANTIAILLTNHLQIAIALIVALRDGNTNEANTLNQQWYQNADQIAATFSQINPQYQYETIRDMLYAHLDLTTAEIRAHLAKNYAADINAFDAVEAEILQLADLLAIGIMKQFPKKF